MNLDQFDNYVLDLLGHDWHFAWSDDSRVYRRGKDNQERYLRTAKKDPRAMEAYKVIQKYVMEDGILSETNQAIEAIRATFK